MLNKAQTSYLVRESFAGFHRRKLTTGVTILIMGSALLVLAILTLVTLNMGHMLEKARQGIDMRVYLRADLTASEMAELQPRLVVIPGVKDVTWISPEMALAEFRENLGEDASILDTLDENPLPASYHLTLVAGSQDRAIPLWQQRKICQILPNSRWLEIEDSGHVVYLERPDVFFPLLRELMVSRSIDVTVPAS